jgi:two-component system, sensor histidine kinase and response regulator
MHPNELAEKISGRKELRNAKLVLMEPLVHERNTKELEAAGFQAMLRKPALAGRLKACLLALEGKGGEEQRWASSKNKEFTPLMHSRRANYKVMVVDDSEPNRVVAMAILEQLGYQNDGAGSGGEALAALSREHYDLVLMDLRMPDMDGLETASAIREGGDGVKDPQVPLVALTANAVTDERLRCFEAGMNDYLTKPVRPRELAAAVDHLLLGEDYENTPADPNPDGTGEASKAAWNPEDLLRRLMDDKDLAAQVVERFRADLPSQMEELEQAWQQRDLEALARHAHTLKGSGANLSAEPLIAAAKALQQAARGEAGTDLDQAWHEMQSRYQELIDALATNKN